MEKIITIQFPQSSMKESRFSVLVNIKKFSKIYVPNVSKGNVFIIFGSNLEEKNWFFLFLNSVMVKLCNVIVIFYSNRFQMRYKIVNINF